jgi:hypothetical protein
MNGKGERFSERSGTIHEKVGKIYFLSYLIIGYHPCMGPQNIQFVESLLKALLSELINLSHI